MTWWRRAQLVGIALAWMAALAEPMGAAAVREATTAVETVAEVAETAVVPVAGRAGAMMVVAAARVVTAVAGGGIGK